MTICIIPARGGSKRIPRKNIRPFLGRPMITWPISAALESGLFDHVIVSTDDAEIASVAAEAGAEVPFTRPRELADDFTGTDAVVAHAIRALGARVAETDAVCCLYATAPFVTGEDLRKGRDLLEESGKEYVFTVCEYPYPIQRALRISPEGVELFQPRHAETRSQDLEPAYHDAGQFYWGRAGAWLRGVPVFSSAAAALVVPPWRVQDIDTEDDWKRAELMMRVLREDRQP